MKKLLLFILVLFGMLSIQSFAWNYGCGENIPPSVCGADGSGTSNTQQTSSNDYYGALAINESTGQWGISYNYTSSSLAKNAALSQCGNNCKVVETLKHNGPYSECASFSYSKKDGSYGYDKAAARMGVGHETKKSRAAEKATKKCEKNGGSSCKVQITFCALENN